MDFEEIKSAVWQYLFSRPGQFSVANLLYILVAIIACQYAWGFLSNRLVAIQILRVFQAEFAQHFKNVGLNEEEIFQRESANTYKLYATGIHPSVQYCLTTVHLARRQNILQFWTGKLMKREKDRIFVEVKFAFKKCIPVVFAVMTPQKYKTLVTDENPDLRKMCKRHAVDGLSNAQFTCLSEYEKLPNVLMTRENMDLLKACSSVLEILHVSDQKYYAPNSDLMIGIKLNLPRGYVHKLDEYAKVAALAVNVARILADLPENETLVSALIKQRRKNSEVVEEENDK